MLGASPHTDLLAHFFGLIAGIAVGLVTTLAMRKSKESSHLVQLVSGLLTVAIVVACWAIALRVRS
jgi:hypothetical protein